MLNLGEQKQIQKGSHENLFNTETMLPISEIKSDTIILKDGGIRSIIKVDGLNLDLKNSDEQQIVLEQYKRFLNGLNFPIQLLIRNTYLDLTNYLGYVQNNVSNIDNMILKKQGEAYYKFLQDIDGKEGLIYVKEFYIVVPYYEGEEDNKKIRRSWFQKLMDTLNSKDNVEKIVARYRTFMKGKNMLDTRVGLIMDGLNGMGITSERLNTSSIISLLFKFYNPLIHSSQSEVEESSFV